MNERIKFLRETLGLTEKEISSFLNISSYKYISFEKTVSEIPCDILILLARIYGLNINSFFDSKYDEHNFLLELEQQGLLSKNKSTVLKILKKNLSQDYNNKISYHTIRKERDNLQQNIINNINKLMRDCRMSLLDFSNYINIDSHSLSSILSKKRFIKLDELKEISKRFKISISDLICN